MTNLSEFAELYPDIVHVLEEASERISTDRSMNIGSINSVQKEAKTQL